VLFARILQVMVLGDAVYVYKESENCGAEENVLFEPSMYVATETTYGFAVAFVSAAEPAA